MIPQGRCKFKGIHGNKRHNFLTTLDKPFMMKDSY